MNISTICMMGSLLVPVTVSASGVIPVLDLDFTRSATETLKKRGINDACIIAATTSKAFTYCREGSATLWKYQDLDLEQQATTQNGEKLSAMDYGRITITEVDSNACEQETSIPAYQATTLRGLTLGLIVLFLLMGLRYTYRATMHMFYRRDALAITHRPRLAQTLPSHNTTAKALGAFAIAAAMAFAYFSYIGL